MAHGPRPAFGIDAVVPIIVFRADASPEIGAGHVMRCLAFAKTMTGLGWECAFAVGVETPATVPALARSGYEILIVGAAPKDQTKILSQRFIDAVDWLVIDHYGFDASFEILFRVVARHIMVIDDLADRPHDCDILLDQGPGRQSRDYSDLVPAHTHVLAGPGYALLDPAYGAYRDGSPPGSPDSRGSIYVSFGATDPHNATVSGLDALEESGAGGPVHVVLGAAAPHRAAVKKRLEAWRSEAFLHIDVAEIIPLLAVSRLGLGAGGVSALERCCCGVPSMIAITADNQRAAAAGFRTAGAAEPIDFGNIAEAARHIAETSTHPDRLARMSAAGQILCDGRGARRVAMVLAPERSGKDAPVWLRPATAADEETILEWQTSPGARRFARNPELPDAATHAAWMQATLNDPEILLNIIECGSRPAGVLRLDRRPARASLPAYEVSILIAPDHHREGIGKAALALARRLVPGVVLLAAVHRDNAASQALFGAAGYVADGGGFALWPDSASQQTLIAAQGELHG